MKTIINKSGTTVLRVPEDRASQSVANGAMGTSWSYCDKSTWKRLVRDVNKK